MMNYFTVSLVTVSSHLVLNEVDGLVLGKGDFSYFSFTDS